jgi:type IV secretory pathway VirB10-like protein
MPSWRATFVTGLLLAACSAATAQWVWKEGDRLVFSDTAPPASVPDKNIVKRPGAGAPLVAPAPVTAPAEGAAVAAVPGAAPAAAAPKLPTVDKELEAKKKQAEQADEARKKAEEQRVAQARAETCAQARKAKATMDSGVRLATTNAKGEREIMDDKARAAEAQRMDSIIRSDCGPMPKTASGIQ